MADAFEPLYFTPEEGGPRRFAVWHWPAAGRVPSRLVVHVPPFAEEMNKSRRMAAMQARLLAAEGAAVLRFDLLGCGDSEGEFGDASWAAWRNDLVQACRWARSRWASQWPATEPSSTWLWAQRAGALLAGDVLGELGPAWQLLLWQPATQGKQVLQQFLRLEAAAALIAGPTATKQPSSRDRLNAGEAVDIAGYRLNPALASGLDAARLAVPSPARRIEWLECSPVEAAAPSPAVAAAAQALVEAGHRVRLHLVRGPAFWQTTEIEDAPALLQASASALHEAAEEGHGSAARAEAA